MADRSNQADGDAWGADIGDERSAELEQRLRDWERDAYHGGRKGPFAGVTLTGADVCWLAARTLAGTNEAQAVAEQMELLRRARDDATFRQYYLDVDLERLHLEGADLDGAQLDAASLDGAHLEGASLRRARLAGAEVRAAHLSGANAVEAHLSGATLAQADLSDTILTNADLSNARLGDTNLSGADLRGTNLRGAIFYETDLSSAAFAHADLRGANLTCQNLRGADLRDARLDRSVRLAATFPWWRGVGGIIVQLYLGGTLFFLLLQLLAFVVILVQGRFRIHMLANAAWGILTWLAFWTALIAFAGVWWVVQQHVTAWRKRRREGAV